MSYCGDHSAKYCEPCTQDVHCNIIKGRLRSIKRWLVSLKALKTVGLISVISYLISVLFMWIYANYQGYTYFQGGESVTIIKYSEWILGFVGIVVSGNYLKKELCELEKE